MSRLLVYFFFLSGLFCINLAQSEEFRFSHSKPPNSYYSEVADKFSACFEKRTDGTYKIQVFGQSQLAKRKEALKLLQDGAFDFALVGSEIADLAPSLKIFSTPLAIPSRGHASFIWENRASELQREAEAGGVYILTQIAGEFLHIANNQRPIHNAGDLSGLKLRSAGGSELDDFLAILEAIPEKISYSEIAGAIRNDQIDGIVTTLSGLTSNNSHQFLKYLSTTTHAYRPYFIAMNIDTLNSLSDEDRITLVDCSAEVGNFSFDYIATIEGGLFEIITQSGTKINDGNLMFSDLNYSKQSDISERILSSEVEKIFMEDLTNTPETCAKAACPQGYECCNGTCQKTCP